MDKPRSYKTRQKDNILAALRQNPERHVTAEELAATLREQGEDVGLATVYRNLDKLVKDGQVLKYTLPDGLRACYQYMDECRQHPHCHLICTACGSVEHLDCTEVDNLASHLQNGHRFALDRQKTVLYGVCAHCATGGEEPHGTPCPHHHT